MKFDVLRRHYGDKAYEEGDEREANEADVKHLIDNGVLRRKREKSVGEAPKNKAAKAGETKAD